MGPIERDKMMNIDKLPRYKCKYSGYVWIKLPNHRRASSRGYVHEHILVVEKAFGRELLSSEVVHHIDGNNSNNYIGNLMIFKTKAMHTAYHARLRAFEMCGHYNWCMCGLCHQYDDPKNLLISGRLMSNAAHKKCKAEYWQEYKNGNLRSIKRFTDKELEGILD